MIAPRRRFGLLVALVAAVAGCGSTVPGTDLSTTGGPRVDAAGETDQGLGPAVAADPSAASSDPDGGAAIGDVGLDPTRDDPADAATIGGTPAGPAPGTSGRGYDPTSVYIGVPSNDQYSDQYSTDAGVSSSDFSGNSGNFADNARGIVAEINRRGGLFGRKVVPVFRDLDTSNSSASPDAEAQAMCTAFTQDRPVLAVINTIAALDRESMYSCLAKARMPFIAMGVRVMDRAFLRNYTPYYHSILTPAWDDFAPVLVDRLQARGYFTGWDTVAGAAGAARAKIGLLYGNAAANTRGFELLRRLLAAKGFRDTETFVYDLSSVQSAFTSLAPSVLQFKSAGVTHVIVDEGVLGVFAQAAEQQQYRPRYGMHTILQPAATKDFSPAPQMAGALGVGWAPTADVNQPTVDSPEQKSCLRAIAATGRNYSGNVFAQQFALAMCDAFWLTMRSFHAGGDATAAGFAAGFARAGPPFVPAATFRSGASAQSPSLVGAVREFGYQQACACLRYLSVATTQIGPRA